MDIIQQIKEIAGKLGFSDCYFLPTTDSEFNCQLLLIYPYQPYLGNTYVSAYYIASNRSYHSYKTFVSALNNISIETKEEFTLVKQLAVSFGIGKQGKNTLLHTDKYGSRMVLYAVKCKLNAALPKIDILPTKDLCKNCTLCSQACSTGAISEKGFNKELCIRYHMENPPYPDWVSSQIETYCGCERCMNACPYNFHIEAVRVPGEYVDILNPELILSGDVKPAKLLLGTNVKTKRLMADAMAITNNKKNL